MQAIGDPAAFVAGLSEAEKAQLDKILAKELKARWLPDPRNEPQLQAYYSEADLLLFGGVVFGDGFIDEDGFKIFSRVDVFEGGLDFGECLFPAFAVGCLGLEGDMDSGLVSVGPGDDEWFDGGMEVFLVEVGYDADDWDGLAAVRDGFADGVVGFYEAKEAAIGLVNKEFDGGVAGAKIVTGEEPQVVDADKIAVAAAKLDLLFDLDLFSIGIA